MCDGFCARLAGASASAGARALLEELREDGSVTTASVSVGAAGPEATGSATSTCSDWTHGGMEYTRNVASPDAVSDGWFGDGVSQCDDASYRFYCLED